MKAVILAGGLGTRLSEETHLKPKPMVEVGGKPILWHIMKIYEAHGITDFIVCLGYKGEVIKDFFLMDRGSWSVSLVDTGEMTATGGRLKRVAPLLKDDFCFTYGDGLSDVDIRKLVAFHRASGCRATVTAVQPPGRFGALEMDGAKVKRFTEKPSEGWINGGFFVLSPDVFNYIDGDQTFFEHAPLNRLAHEGQLAAYRHRGFWHAMDTLRDKQHLDAHWAASAPWKAWP